MFVTIILGLLTLVVSAIAAYTVDAPGFDLTLISMIIAAHAGENILVAALVFSLAYMLPKPSRFTWFPLEFVSAWLVGWMVVTYDLIYLPIVVFHGIATLWSLVVGSFGGRFLMHTFVNVGLTLIIARFYVLIFL